jgi:hypothetical protein
MFTDMTDLEKVEQIRKVLSALMDDAREEADHAWELKNRESYDLWQVSADTFLLTLSLIDQAWPEFRQVGRAEELLECSE